MSKGNIAALLIVIIMQLLWLPVNGGQELIIKGRILDEKSNPLQFVNVFLTDSYEGAMSDENGNFLLKTDKTGKRILRISHIGYEQQDLEIILKSGKPLELTITLKESFVPLATITIIASSFTAADEEGQTLNSMDVVTTAGAAADIFRALQTFPGVNRVDEGAGMFVRGGDVSETVILLDGATLAHPYRYESDTGGYFGMINPFLLSGTYFSTGAFSAKYGNALSGVLAMQSLGLPTEKSLDLSLGLAALSIGGNYPVLADKLGIRFSGNYSNTEPLFLINGGAEEFTSFPISWDANLSIIYNYSRTGTIKYFNFATRDDIGVLYESPSYSGTLISGNKNFFNNLYWKEMPSDKLFVESSLSTNRFSQDFGVGNLDINSQDRLIKWRTDFSFFISKDWKINSGLEIDRTLTAVSGSYPLDENDLSPAAAQSTFQSNYNATHEGICLETEMNLFRRLFTISGLRMDYANEIGCVVVDPRFSLGYRLSDIQIIKLATGIYHQYPKNQCLDPNYGNPDLLPLKAIHYVAGYELKSDPTDLRIEIYYKDYANLPLTSNAQNYTNDGYGYAYGADFFLKGNLPVVSGWISYGYLVSKRKEYEYLTLVPTDCDIRHNFTAALKTMFGRSNSIGLTYNYTSGKPWTPAFGQWNTNRLPPIQRLDISWSYYTPLKKSSFLVVYAAVSNLLDRHNIYGYRYNSDYTERTAIKSTYGRNYYFGLTLSL